MIEVDQVSKVHSRGGTEVRALRELSCRIPQGAFTFIVGPSGSGKSTLLYLLGALDEPSSGTVRVGGRALAALTPKERDAYRRDEVGFIFQNFNLLGNLDAVENVLIPFLPSGQSGRYREEAEMLLKRVGLGQRLHHRPNHLSGGEQQRVAVVRALLKKPALVLADEPTGELDSQNGMEIFRDLRTLTAEHGSTVVVVTHDQRYIEPGDLVLRIDDGQLVEGAA